MSTIGKFSLRRLFILGRNDLWYSISGRKGLFFLVPYLLFWISILDKLLEGAAAWLQSPAGLAMAAWMFSAEMALALFKSHPPTLSAFYLVSLFVLPLFCSLAACNQLAGDAGRGYFRYLLPRSSRDEIFLARLLSPWLLISVSTLIVGIACTVVALQIDGHETADVLAYALRINLILPLYILPFVALMAWVSASFNSAGASLFGVFLMVVVVKTSSWALQWQWPDMSFLDYLLPGHVSGLLIDTEPGSEVLGLGLLLVYALIYAALGWWVFKRRDL